MSRRCRFAGTGKQGKQLRCSFPTNIYRRTLKVLSGITRRGRDDETNVGPPTLRDCLDSEGGLDPSRSVYLKDDFGWRCGTSTVEKVGVEVYVWRADGKFSVEFRWRRSLRNGKSDEEGDFPQTRDRPGETTISMRDVGPPEVSCGNEGMICHVYVGLQV